MASLLSSPGTLIFWPQVEVRIDERLKLHRRLRSLIVLWGNVYEQCSGALVGPDTRSICVDQRSNWPRKMSS